MTGLTQVCSLCAWDSPGPDLPESSPWNWTCTGLDNFTYHRFLQGTASNHRKSEARWHMGFHRFRCAATFAIDFTGLSRSLDRLGCDHGSTYPVTTRDERRGWYGEKGRWRGGYICAEEMEGVGVGDCLVREPSCEHTFRFFLLYLFLTAGIFFRDYRAFQIYLTSTSLHGEKLEKKSNGQRMTLGATLRNYNINATRV